MLGWNGQETRSARTLVVYRNGRPTMVSGWRAWLLGLGAVLGAIAALFLVAFFFLGLALTIGAVLLVAVPAAIVIAILGSAQSRRP